MTDKEIIEYAAKAAGMDLKNYIWSLEKFWWVNPEGYVTSNSWNPLTDDGDALRLAVKLGLVIRPLEGEISIELPHTGFPMIETLIGDYHPYAATRRAITRAAAEIGKEMK